LTTLKKFIFNSLIIKRNIIFLKKEVYIVLNMYINILKFKKYTWVDLKLKTITKIIVVTKSIFFQETKIYLSYNYVKMSLNN